MGLGSTGLGVFTSIIPCLAMYVSTWETFHTHTLYLGYINGPTEGLLIAMAFMIASGYYGPQIWEQPIAKALGHPEVFGDCSVRDLWVPFLLLGFLLGHLPSAVYNVASARRKHNLPVGPVFKEWLPMIAFAVCSFAWLLSPYSTLLAENRLVLYCWTISFVFGRMTTKIILSHLLKQPFPGWTILIAPLFGGVILANMPIVGLPKVSATVELWYLRAYLFFAFISYMHWALLVINRITTFLGINCLTIRENKPAARDRAYREFGEPEAQPLASSRPESPNSPNANKNGVKSL